MASMKTFAEENEIPLIVSFGLEMPSRKEIFEEDEEIVDKLT